MTAAVKMICLIAAVGPSSPSGSAGRAEPAKDQDRAGERAGVAEDPKRRPAETSSPPPGPVGETVVLSRPSSPVRPKKKTLSSRRLLRSGERDVASALEWELGVQTVTNVRGEKLLSFRGFEQRQMPVYLDGVPLQIPYDGRLDLSKIPVGVLGKVSLVKGPSSLALGPTGMGGALLLSTRDPRRAPLLVFDGRVSQGGAHHHAATSFSGRRWGVAASADMMWRRYWALPAGFSPERNEDGAERENSDRKALSMGLSARWEPSTHHTFSLVGMGSLGAYGVPPSTRTFNPRYWRFNDYDVAAITAQHTGRWTDRLKVSEALYVSYFYNLLDAYDTPSYTLRESDKAFSSIYRDWSVGGRLSLTADLPEPRWAEWMRLYGWLDTHHDRHRHIWVDQPDPPVAASTYFNLAVEGAAGFSGGHQVRLQVQSRGELPSPMGASRPDATLFFGPLVTYGWSRRGWRLYATAARRARFPSLKERYSNAFGRRAPNPDLQPESAYQLLWGATYSWPRWARVSISAHTSLVEDIIDERPVGDGVLQQDNMGSGILAGGELEVAFRTGSGVSGRAGYAYLFARKLEAGIDGRKELSGRSPHQLFLEGAYEFWRFASVRTGLRVLSPTPVRDPDTGAMITSEPVVDWRARVAIGPVFGLTAYVEITNLLDRVNELVPGFPGPGRTFWVGVRAVKR